MAIDTDIQSFSEYNANCSDENTKLTQLTPLVANTALTSADNNKIPVRRSGVWSIEGEEAYNGYYQDFGNISGEVVLTMNGDSCRTAMTATITGNTFVTGFGANFAAGVVYLLLVKQNGTGGFTVRWPYGASVLKQVGTSPNQMTEVYILKLPSGKVFIKCEAFQNTTQVGSVIKEFETPRILYPDSESSPYEFTWSKSAAIYYGGTISGLYSDWEIADDALYTNLLFSSYGNSSDLTSIQVILSQEFTAYMRTRYGGTIGGTPIVSSWDELVVNLTSDGTIVGDQYWDQTVFCLNANSYNGETPKIADSREYFKITNYGIVRPIEGNGHVGLRFNGTYDLLLCPDSVAFRPTTEDFTFEVFFSVDNPANGSSQFIFIKSSGNSYSPFVFYIISNGKLEVAFYRSNLSYFLLNSLLALEANRVYHASVVRSGSSFKLFLDGVLQQEIIESVTLYSNASHSICFGAASNYTYRFTGYIYSVRITKNIARYTTDFNVILSDPYFKTGNLWWTPEPKQIATGSFIELPSWNKTECLINGYGAANSTSIIDSIGKSITVGGNAKIDVSSNLSSVIFDGSGDYLYVGNMGDWNFLHNGTCNWTAEFWFNPGVVSEDGIFDTCEGSSSNHGVCCYFEAGTGKLTFMVSRGSGSVSTTALQGVFSYVFSTSTVYHVAITLDWSLSTDNAKLYVNGTLQSTITKKAYAPSSSISYATLMIGGFGTSYPTYMFNGKIYSFRISSYLRYTANFSVDNTRPYFIAKPKVENWPETSLLINALDLPIYSTDIRDDKGNSISVYGDTKIAIDSNDLKYINFDGTGDYLTNDKALNNIVGSSNFTFEFFYKATSTSVQTIVSDAASFDGYYAIRIDTNSSGTLLQILIYDSSSVLITINTNVSVTLGTIAHVAIVRNDTVINCFVNGILAGTGTITTGRQLYSISSSIKFGVCGTSQYFTGSIYSFRLVTGKVLYTSNFNVDLTNPYFPSYNDVLADFWVDANDFSKITLATGVSEIKDKSVNKISTTQGTTTSQPALLENAKNGLRALDFDGSNDFLNLGTVLGKPANFTVIVLAVFDTMATKRNICGSGNSAGQSSTGWGDIGAGRTSNDGKFEYSIGDGTNYAYGRSTNNVISAGSWFIFESLYSGGNKPKQYLDGLEIPVTYEDGTGVSCGGTAYNFSIGKSGEYAGQYFDGKLLDTIIFKFAIVEFLYHKIVGYLAHKASHLAALPATHPYKASPPSDDRRTDDYWYAVALCLDPRESIKNTDIFDSKKINKISVFGNTFIGFADYSPYINFDGTGDYLSSPANPSFYSFGTGDFTIEVVFSINTLGTNKCLLSSYGTWSSVLAFYLRVGSDNKLRFLAGNNVPLDIYSTPTITNNTVYHVAICRVSGVTTMYLDGTSVGSSSTVATITNTASVFVGAANDAGENFNGKIYSMRITKGVARYTQNFTFDLAHPYFPKIQKEDVNVYDKYWHKVIFNISSELSTITDYKGRSITNSGVAISTDLGTDKPSMYFNGSSYFTEPATDCGFLVYKNDSWTLEFFILATTTANYRGVMQYGTNNNSFDPAATFLFNSGSREIYTGFTGSSGAYGSLLVACPNELAHVAFCFNNTTRLLKTFINGVLYDTANLGAVNGTLPANGNVYFGRYTSGSLYFTGHITSMRLTKGVERYTENFTPLTRPYFPRMI